MQNIEMVSTLESRLHLSGNMSVGTNLEGISDWTAPVFTDVFNQARSWGTRNADGTGAWNTAQSVPTDPNGWPLQIPFTPTNGGTPQIAHTQVPVSGPGIYKLTLEGKGTLRFTAYSGLLNPTTANGSSITYQFTGGLTTRDLTIYSSAFGNGRGPIYIDLISSNPTDPIRNIDLVTPGFENTYKTQPFLPSFTKHLAPFKTLRFMDWAATNGNPITSWNQRTTPNSHTQSGGAGASFEYMIQLSNQLNKDPYITIPARADPTYIRNTAKLFRDNLKPSLKLYVEYSNETWNSQFSQTTYVQDQGQALGLNANRWTAGQLFVAYQSAQIWSIFEQEFGPTASARLIKVMASQAAGTGITQTRMDALQDPRINPAKVMPDVLAIAPYFAGSVANALVRDNRVATATVDDILALAQADLRANSTAWVTSQKALADRYSVILTTYESGQHLVGSGGNENNQVLTDKLIAANRDPRMYNLYREYQDMLRDNGIASNVNFSYTGAPTKWGSWGILELAEQSLDTAPKYRAIKDWVRDNPASNVAPIARAGEDISVFASNLQNSPVTLDATKSRDFDGTIVAYEWRLANGTRLGTDPLLKTSLPIGRHDIELRVTDNAGAVKSDWLQVLVAPISAASTLIQSDFTGKTPGQATPWTKTTTLDAGTDFSGWTRGSGLTGQPVDNAFAFSGNFGNTGDTTLANALSANQYLSVALAAKPNRRINLSSAKLSFTIDRIDYHAPRQYVVLSSVDGFSIGKVLFDSSRFDTLDPTTFSFNLPIANFGSLQKVEFRIYTFGSQYLGHRSSVTAFTLNGKALPPSGQKPLVPAPARYEFLPPPPLRPGLFAEEVIDLGSPSDSPLAPTP